MLERKKRSWGKCIANLIIFVLAVGQFSFVNSFAQGNGFIISKNGQELYPIGSYELPKSDAELSAMASSGINIVHCTSREDLERVSKIGLMGWYSLDLSQGKTDKLEKQIESVMDHPALAVWDGPDEIVWTFTASSVLWRKGKAGIFEHKGEWWMQTPEVIRYSENKAAEIIPKLIEGIDLVKSLDRKRHQIWINEARNSDLKFCRQYMDYIDITGCDYYPIRGKIRDAIKLGKTTERWSQTGMGKPVWIVLQAFSWSELGKPGSHYYAPKAYPSFEESRLMAYVSIVYGAKGILYWGSSQAKTPSNFRQSLYAVTNELSALQPFLVSPEQNLEHVRTIEFLTAGPVEGWFHEQEGWPPPRALGVRSSARKAGDDWLIILVNEDNFAHYGVEVSGLNDLNGRKLYLLYGEENTNVTKGEFVTRMKPFEVKVFATSKKYETDRHKGRDYAGVFVK